MFHFLLIAESRSVEQLKVGTHFRHDIFQVLAKRLGVAHKKFCSLRDDEILFNLLERVALLGVVKLLFEGLGPRF